MMDTIYDSDVEVSEPIIYLKGNDGKAYIDSGCTIQYTTTALKQAYLNGCVIYAGNDEFDIPVYYAERSSGIGYVGYLYFRSNGDVYTWNLRSKADPT